MPVPMLPPARADNSRMAVLNGLIRSGLADTPNASRILELEAALDVAKREAEKAELLLAKTRARAESAENALAETNWKLADAEEQLDALRLRAEREFLKLTAECAEWKRQVEEAERRVPAALSGAQLATLAEAYRKRECWGCRERGPCDHREPEIELLIARNQRKWRP
jgi:predicted  nucleic acid-binding Zn-ribbon protein